ncbi:MAG TPA: cell division protein ZapA [Myxococcota bacterium]|nr:cell division protein ZapA [Myxococcota bacterium]
MAKRSIAVRILGAEYRIRSEADESAVRRVAALVEETMVRIRDRTQTVDTLDLAVLAALNLANDLIALREGAQGAETEGHPAIDPERLRGLIAAVESAAAESPGLG